MHYFVNILIVKQISTRNFYKMGFMSVNRSIYAVKMKLIYARHLI